MACPSRAAGFTFGAFLLVIAPIFTTSAVAAQDISVAVAPGTRIRVLRTGDDTPQEATFVSFDHDTLLLKPGGCCIVDSIPIESITAVDVSGGIGVSAGRVAGGIVFGALAGTVVGWGVGNVACSMPESGELCGLGVALLATALGAGGAVLGVVWGIESKVERWERIYPPGDVALLVAPTSEGGISVGASIPIDMGSPLRHAKHE